MTDFVSCIQIEKPLLDKWSFHFWKGLENQYPLCCIIWFCDVQTNKGEQIGSLYERIYREEYDKLNHCQQSKMNRAMCPDCLERFMQQ